MISYLLELFFSILLVALLFCGTVLVHELGHFLTALWFKLRIDAFSIGMGPALWKKQYKGVEYKLSLLPIGGYVALPQMDITGSAFENEDAQKGRLDPVAPWKRIIVAVAGPLMNILAAFVICVIVWLVGKPYDAGPEAPIVGWVSPSSVAHKAGLREGDRVLTVNGDRVDFWTDFIIANSLNKEVNLVVQREGRRVELPPMATLRNPLGFLSLSGVLEVEKVEYVFAGEVIPASPAAQAGLLEGDVLVDINGEPVTSDSRFRAAVQAAAGQTVTVQVRRPEETTLRRLEITPHLSEDKVWLIGIRMGQKLSEEFVHPTPMNQMRYFSGVLFRTLRGLVRSRERGEAGNGIGGPVMMLGSIHQQVRIHPMQALWFTALINVNLAIINLLPIIILDGGHITLALFEIVSGRKLPKRLITAMANLVAVFLIGLMIILTFKDVLLYRRLDKLKQQMAAEQQATPTPVPAATVQPVESLPVAP